jgi:hypothetical protein
MTRRAWLGLAVLAAGVAQGGNGEKDTVRGKLRQDPSGRPFLETGGGKVAALEGDDATNAVLRDGRLAGREMELIGEFHGDSVFRVGPIHTQAMFVLRDGKRFTISFWCDLCAIRTYSPGRCMCCQEETELDLREHTAP